MKKNFLIANIVLFATFFLVVLGMRNTSLDHNLGPKQRPRAVVEDASKAPIVICCDQHLQLDAVATPAYAITARSTVRSTFLRLVVCDAPALVQLYLPSRASPAPALKLS